ncbi:MAG: IS607 family transposase [Desulfurococcales archaeon]|nr:IS607 family transposase [Desulfurococcales archaeon]
MNKRLLPPREASKRLGIHYVTLKRWIYSGKIRAVRTPSGRWMIPEGEVERIIGGEEEAKEVRAVIYARVSSPDQKRDLERQIEYLTQYCTAKGYRVVGVLSDVASGLKTSRRGLMELLDHVVNRRVDVVVVTYRDRLTRFGFEYLEYFFNQYGVRVEAVYGEEARDARQELVEDLLAIVMSFAGKLYGLRSRRRKKLIQGFKKLLGEVEEDG